MNPLVRVLPALLLAATGAAQCDITTVQAGPWFGHDVDLADDVLVGAAFDSATLFERTLGAWAEVATFDGMSFLREPGIALSNERLVIGGDGLNGFAGGALIYERARSWTNPTQLIAAATACQRV